MPVICLLCSVEGDRLADYVVSVEVDETQPPEGCLQQRNITSIVIVTSKLTQNLIEGSPHDAQTDDSIGGGGPVSEFVQVVRVLKKVP